MRAQRGATVAVLGALYLAQGVVAGFFGFVLIPTLAANGASLQAQTGLVALAGLPWVLKVFWGPVLDRFGARSGGRARPIVTMATLAVAAMFWWMGRGVPTTQALVDNLARVQWQWLLLSVLLSLQDVGTDALALDRIRPHDRGLANGVMLGGQHLGVEGVGGLGLGAVVGATGVGGGFAGVAVLLVVLAGAPMLLPATLSAGEGAGAVPSGERPPAGSTLRALRAMISTPAARFAAWLALVIMVGNVLTSAVSGAFWVERLRWSPARVSGELAPLLLGASLVGYVVAATAVDRIGHARAASVGAFGLGGLWVGFGLAEVWWTDDAFMRGFVVLQALADAVMMVGVYALLMGATVPRLRATHFTLLMALVNLPRVLLAPLAPGLLEALGFAGLFMACGIVQVGVGAWVRGRAGVGTG